MSPPTMARRRTRLLRAGRRRMRTIPSAAVHARAGHPAGPQGHAPPPSEYPIQVRIGIATGLVVVGDLIRTMRFAGGVDRRRDAESRRPAASRSPLPTPSSSARPPAAASAGCSSCARATRLPSRASRMRWCAGRWSARRWWKAASLPRTKPRCPTRSAASRSFLCSCGAGSSPAAARASSVLLSGQAGIGKSRLAETLCARSRRRTAFARGLAQCSPHHTNSPLLSGSQDARALRRRILPHGRADDETAQAARCCCDWLGPDQRCCRCSPACCPITDETCRPSLPASIP